jgi:hypothetical protein
VLPFDLSEKRTPSRTPGSPLHVVTKAQRARLVVAMGLLNLILATVALTAGVVAPARPNGEVPANGGAPSPSRPVASPGASEPTPTSSAGANPEPTPSGVGPSLEPSVEPSGEPSVEPSVKPSASTAIPTEPPIVAVLPTPTGGSTGPSQPPLVSTPRPTVRPTPRPTPSPEPVAGKVHKPRPPCPGDASGPPGHNKVAPPPSRPCTPGTPNGNGSGGNGMVVVLPLALGGLAATIRTWFLLSSRRLVRATRSKRGHRRAGRVHGEA